MDTPEDGLLRFESLGTAWEIGTLAPLASDLAAAVGRALDDFDRTWSRFRADSLVSERSRVAGPIPLGPATEAMFDLYDLLDRLTEGAVSPLVGGSLAALGYDAEYTLQAGVPAPAPDGATLRRTPDRLEVLAPATIDIGAVGKGLAVDLVADLLTERGARLRWVDASGDLRCGVAPLRVALEDPADPTKAVGVVRLAPGQAIAASATNRRAWGRDLHHVLDARTGLPVGEVSATWAVASSAMVADAASTAAFFAPADAVAGALSSRSAPVGVVRMLDTRVVEVGGMPELLELIDLEVFR